MKQSLKSPAGKSGLPPGTLVHVGNYEQNESEVSALAYNSKKIQKLSLKSPDELLEYKDKDYVVWVNITGLKNVNLIEDIGKSFDIHSLVLEDILNTHQRVKFDNYQNYLFFVLKKLHFDSDKIRIIDDQISLLVMNNFVFTFIETIEPLFDSIKKRLNNTDCKLRCNGTDYLAYTLIDTIVDNYFILLDKMEEITESIDDELITNPTINTLHTIQAVKRELISTRRSISPLREGLSAFFRSDSPLIKKKTEIYFRDVYDHSIRIIESLDSYRELVSGLSEIYLSSISNKMNAEMKVLTVFASIFIPLTFIAGVYGMNFEYMPELKMKWAYPSLWCLFLLIIIILLVFFKKKKWL